MYRLYVDTSVYGGCYDPEFQEDSRRLVEHVRQGRIRLLMSDVVVRELQGAPEDVQQLVISLPQSAVEIVPLTQEVIRLRNAYLAAGILTVRSINDATHVAAATVARADAIVSWNFRHIVRLDKMRAYNQVNLAHGYGLLSIVTPRGVQFDDEINEGNV